MRRIFFAAAVAAVSATALFAGNANAITAAPDGVRAAADATVLTQDVRWVCRFGYYGGRRCFWVRDYGAYGYYPGYRRYQYGY
jgi:hypothetical protein